MLPGLNPYLSRLWFQRLVGISLDAINLVYSELMEDLLLYRKCGESVPWFISRKSGTVNNLA